MVTDLSQKDARDVYNKRKVKLAVFGLTLSLVSALTLIVFQNLNVVTTSLINEQFPQTILATYVLTLFTLAICEFIGGILMILFNSASGIPLAEYARTWKVKSSRTVLIAAIVSGPLATACSLIGISFSGSTYGNCVIGLTPIITAILGSIFLKEKTGIRVFFGIVITVLGVVIASSSPPEGVKNFYLGLLIVAVAPIGYSIEAIISTHAMDVSDSRIVCPLYRMIGGSIIEFIFVIGVSFATGHMEWIMKAFEILVSSPMIIMLLLLTSLFMTIQYNSIYVAYGYCGATRGSAILFSSSIWSIPIGVIMAKMGIISYSVTSLGIVSTVVIVIGIIVVLAKPSELFNLRDV